MAWTVRANHHPERDDLAFVTAQYTDDQGTVFSFSDLCSIGEYEPFMAKAAVALVDFQNKRSAIDVMCADVAAQLEEHPAVSAAASALTQASAVRIAQPAMVVTKPPGV